MVQHEELRRAEQLAQELAGRVAAAAHGA